MKPVIDATRIQELQRGWTPPTELTAHIPREARWSAAGLAFLAVAGAFAVAGVLVAGNFGLWSNPLRSKGMDAEGHVTAVYHSPYDPISIHYLFNVNGLPYEGYAYVAAGVSQKLAPGAPLAVRYLPANPGRNEARGLGSPPIDGGSLFVGLLFAAIGLSLLSIPVRERRLLLQGSATPAVVTGIGHGKFFSSYICYHFVLPDGSLCKGHSGATYRVRPIGTRVTVIYDSHKPKRNSLYPMEKVALRA
jgi:hypothetical protein